MTRHRLLPLVLLGAALLGACGSPKDTSSSSSQGGSASAADCQKGKLDLYAKGKLTVATDKPAYPPYFEDNDPTNGKGLESAVAYGIAKRLGFSRGEVSWTVVPFNSSYAPGPKKFDFDVNEISITPQRAKHVDFSTPYFTAPQAVVALKGSSAANAERLAGVRGAEIGVQVGTTSLDAVKDVVKPTTEPKVFNDSNDVVAALKSKQVDAVVVDLPTAFYLTTAQVPAAKIVGQFKAPGGDPWGALLKHGSSLTACADRAVAGLRSSGELQRITQRWIGAQAGAPELR